LKQAESREQVETKLKNIFYLNISIFTVIDNGAIGVKQWDISRNLK
jgi:hypothetical protein